MRRAVPFPSADVHGTRAGFAPPDDPMVYVYGVARSGAMTQSAAALVDGIMPGTSVELLPIGDLAIVMSPAPQDTAGETDSDDSTERALAHHRVLANLAVFCTVAPVKNGAVRRRLHKVLTYFVGYGSQLEQALDRVAGAQEWCVKLHADIGVCLAGARASLAMKARQSKRSSLGPSWGLFRHKPSNDELSRELHRDLATRAKSVHRIVAGWCREVAPIPLRGLATGWNGHAPMLIHETACLVNKAGEAEFKQALADLGAALEPEGFSLELIGPRPPYNFAAVDIEGDGIWDR